MFGKTIQLLNAIQSFQNDEIRGLISSGARVNFKDNLPAYTACKNGNLKALKELISMGADVTLDTKYFWVAVENGRTNVVDYLVEIYNDPTMINDALGLASRKREYGTCLHLISKLNADPTFLEKSRGRGPQTRKARQRFIDYVIKNGSREELKSIYKVGCGYPKYMLAFRYDHIINWTNDKLVSTRFPKVNFVGYIESLVLFHI